MPLICQVLKPEDFTPTNLAEIYHKKVKYNPGDFCDLPEGERQFLVDAMQFLLQELVDTKVLGTGLEVHLNAVITTT